MKRIFLISLLVSVFVITSQAQNSRRVKEEPVPLKERIWYGLNVGNISFFNGTFGAGLSPMAGYKFTDKLAVGAIVKLDYLYTRYSGYPFHSMNVSAGGFMRYRILQSIFAHAEYEVSRFELPSTDFGSLIVDNGKIVKDSYTEPYFYIGAGYSTGRGRWASEIALMYNVLDQIDYYRTPWDLRVGFTYNF